MYNQENKTIAILPLLEPEREQIVALTVHQSQLHFIESSAQCLEDARTDFEGIPWNIDGIYVGEELAGFAMHGLHTETETPRERVWLDRFMMDGKFQGKGYGKKALLMLIPMLYDRYNCTRLYLSAIEANEFAISLYESLGFVKTPFQDSNGERIMTRDK